MVTREIVLTKLSTQERDELRKIHDIKPFVAEKKTMKNWIRVDLTPKELSKILPYKKSYENTEIT